MKKNLNWVQKGLCFLTTATLLSGCGAPPKSAESGGGMAAGTTAAETWAVTGEVADMDIFYDGEAGLVSGGSSMTMKSTQKNTAIFQKTATNLWRRNPCPPSPLMWTQPLTAIFAVTFILDRRFHQTPYGLKKC